MCIIFINPNASTAKRNALDPKSIMSFWKPEVAIRVVTDSTAYPTRNGNHFLSIAAMYLWLFLCAVPFAVRPQIIFSEKSKRDMRRGRSYDDTADKATYKPAVHADEIGLTSDKYIPLNDTVDSLPLKISCGPMSMQVSCLCNMLLIWV